MVIEYGGHHFEVDQHVERYRTLRGNPNGRWTSTDAAGHEHYWTFDGARGKFRQDAKAELPTLEWVVTGQEQYEDEDEPHDIGEHRCKVCGERVYPAYGDDTPLVYKSPPRYFLDGAEVTQEALIAKAREIGLPLD